MKRGNACFVLILVGAVGWLVSKSFSAPGANPPNPCSCIAVVDLVQVFNDFTQTKVVNRKMLEVRKKLSEEKDKRQADIDADKTALNAFNPNTADWFKRNQELKKKRIDFTVWQEMTLEELGEHHLRWTRRTYEMLIDEIAATAKKHGVQLVVTREELDMPDTADTKTQMQAITQQIFNRKVVYSDPSLDLSAEVLANLNAAFEKNGGEKAIDPTK